MILNIPIQTRKPEKITVEEVRLELRKIEDHLFGELVTPNSLINLNVMLNNFINIPYNLQIVAELVGNNVKLFGYNRESKEILDPNFKKDFIEKKR